MKYSVKYLGTAFPRPIVHKGVNPMTPEECAERLTALEGALHELYDVLLHEEDNGRMPTKLKGIGLGKFEDALAGVSNPVAVKDNTDADELEDFRRHKHDFVKAIEAAKTFEAVRAERHGCTSDPCDVCAERYANVSNWDRILYSRCLRND